MLGIAYAGGINIGPANKANGIRSIVMIKESRIHQRSS
jgi:hypothetical protein